MVPRLLATLALALARARCLRRPPPTPPTGGSRSPTTSGRRPRSQLDLGEHVTWYWVGPDVVHSVTGDSPQRARARLRPERHPPPASGRRQLPAELRPAGRLLSSSASSTARFAARSRSPTSRAIPSAEPDPVPPNRVDLKAPKLRKLELASPLTGARRPSCTSRSARTRSSTPTTTASGPSGDAHVRRLREMARATSASTRSASPPAARTSTPSPGRYVAELRATDRDNNLSKPRELRFEIRRARDARGLVRLSR